MPAPYPLCPRINASGVAWDATFPLRPWNYRSAGVGGSAQGATGVQEAYVIRTDHVVRVTLRFFESEWAAVERELSHARDAAVSFLFRFDQDDAATEHTVYLDRPVWPDALEPTRDEAYPNLFTIDVELRTASGLPFATSWAALAFL